MNHIYVYLSQIQKRQSSGSMDDRPLMWVKDYVESLHQNSRATLLFGKNNVLVQPVCVCSECGNALWPFDGPVLISAVPPPLSREMTWRPSRATSRCIKRLTSWHWSGRPISWWTATWESLNQKKGEAELPELLHSHRMQKYSKYCKRARYPLNSDVFF